MSDTNPPAPRDGDDTTAHDDARDDLLPPTGDDAPTGGDEGTEEGLQADNEAEEEMLKALDPEAPSA